MGVGTIRDVSVSGNYKAALLQSGSTNVVLIASEYVSGTSVLLSPCNSTFPIAFAVGDIISASAIYEIA